MTHFQAPGNRSLGSSVSTLGQWPANPDGYRFFVSGNAGDERLGVEIGRRVDLQITNGVGFRISNSQDAMIESVMDFSVPAGFELADKLPRPVRSSAVAVETNPQIITIAAKQPGKTILTVLTDARNRMASLEVVIGHFENHPGMKTDLIAEFCRGSDVLKIHALQRMLNNRWVSGSGYTNGDNIFSQQAPTNTSSDPNIGTMSCGVVAKDRGLQIFDKVLAPTFPWYQAGAIHEPLWSRVTDRRQVKYRSQRVETLRMQILQALNNGQAVRVGVLDDPVNGQMTPQNGDLIAYNAGGHTVLIVGASDDGKQFLYIDPWSGGSNFEYQGGIPGAKPVSGKCVQLGKLIVTHDPDRRVSRTDTGNNIIRQHLEAQGTFNYANNNYLEVVSAPFVVPGRK